MPETIVASLVTPSADAPARTDSAPPSPSSSPPSASDALSKEGVSVTTGRPLPAGSVYRPVLAVIDNAPQSRPQTGLMLADIVYEFPLDRADHGTRFLAIFSDEIPARVGPITSSRAYLADTALEWDGLYVCAGDPPGGDAAYPPLAETGLAAALPHDADAGGFFYQDATISSDKAHTLFFKALDAAGALSASEPSIAPRFAFEAGVSYDRGRRVQSVGLPFTSSDKEKIVYTYDAAANRLLRSEKNSKGALDASKALTAAADQRGYTSEAVSAQNLIVQYVRVYALDTIYRGVDVTGEGKCDYFINGLHVGGTWSRPTLADATTYLLYDGTPIRLEPGSTWIEMMPANRDVRIRYAS